MASFVGVPTGWLLSYGALLPFYLGLFFFMLFGLLLGAVAFRFGSPAGQLSKSAVRGGMAIIVAITWSASMYTEARVFPDQVAEESMRQCRKLPEGMSGPEEFRALAAKEVVAYMGENYAPGGVFGYVRWAVSSSLVNPPTGLLRKPFRSSQPRGWWIARVLLSILLLGYGIYTQIVPLAKKPEEFEELAIGQATAESQE